MYLSSERKEYILKVLADRGSVRTVVLSKEMDVTDETVRNDLIILEKSGLLKRVHGGAISLKKKVMNETLMTDIGPDVEIAKATTYAINAGDTVFIEGGPISNLAASYLPPLPLTVVTNSPAIINRLEGKTTAEIYCTGGRLDRQTGLLCSIESAKSIEMLGIDTVFLEPNSYDPVKGPGYSSLVQAKFIQELVGVAKKIIILCPAAQMEASATYYPVKPEQIDQIITNENAPEELLRGITASGVVLQKV